MIVRRRGNPTPGKGYHGPRDASSILRPARADAAEVEAKIIAHESGVNFESAASLAKLAEKVRNLKEHGLEEGVSTRLLIYAGQLMVQGVAPRRACEVAVAQAVTDDLDVGKGIVEVIRAIFP